MGIQVGFRLPVEANFDKLMTSFKGKMIAWGNCNLSLAGRILVANQILLSSIHGGLLESQPHDVQPNQGGS